jgi:hypothetical protein
MRRTGRETTMPDGGDVGDVLTKSANGYYWKAPEAGQAGPHTHPQAEVTDLEAALAGKSDVGHTHAGGSGPAVKSGLVNLGAGLSANVTFATPFASVPHVVVTSQINNADTSCTYSVHTVTANGFTLRGAGNPAGNVAWIATTAGNA